MTDNQILIPTIPLGVSTKLLEFDLEMGVQHRFVLSFPEFHTKFACVHDAQAA